jgi:hypothetical protein
MSPEKLIETGLDIYNTLAAICFTETKNCVEHAESEKRVFSSMYFCAHVAQNSGENFIFGKFKAIFFWVF